MKKIVTYSLQIVISALCLYWVFRHLKDAGLSGPVVRIEHIEPGYLACACLLATLLNVIRLLRLRLWTHGLSAQPQSLSFWADMYLKSTAFGAFTPGRVGELSRIFILGRTGLDTKTRTFLVIQEKILDALLLPFSLLFCAGAIGGIAKMPPVIFTGAGGAILGAGLIASALLGRGIGRRGILTGWAIALAAFVLYVATNYCIFQAAGAMIDIRNLTAIAIVSGFLANLPVSFGGIGVREGSLAALLNLWGVGKEAQVIIIALEFFINSLWPVILYGLWLIGRFIIPGAPHDAH